MEEELPGRSKQVYYIDGAEKEKNIGDRKD
jgi:hypothetical protein